MDELREYFSAEGPERCGIITKDWEIIELPNIHPTPDTNFAMESEPLLDPNTLATWHTHPTTGPNLSVSDYYSFAAFPALRHYVVSALEIWCFGMADDILVRRKNSMKARQENDPASPTRPPEGTPP